MNETIELQKKQALHALVEADEYMVFAIDKATQKPVSYIRFKEDDIVHAIDFLQVLAASQAKG